MMANKIGSANATRQRQYRMRRRGGRIVLVVEVEEIPLVEQLIEAKLLREENRDSREALTRAVETVLEVWSKPTTDDFGTAFQSRHHDVGMSVH